MLVFTILLRLACQGYAFRCILAVTFFIQRLQTFYSASALLAMQTAILARSFLSVRPSICLSFRHVPVLCPDERRYDRAEEVKFIQIFAGDHP